MSMEQLKAEACSAVKFRIEGHYDDEEDEDDDDNDENDNGYDSFSEHNGQCLTSQFCSIAAEAIGRGGYSKLN